MRDRLLTIALIPSVWIALCANAAAAGPPQTAFSYQGYLTQGAYQATGLYDLRFTLYDLPVDGKVVGESVHLEDIRIQNGLFIVELDFGPRVFDGQPRWLEVAVRPGASKAVYLVLPPNHQITPTPYAIHATRAENAAIALSAKTAESATTADNATTATTATTAENAIEAQHAKTADSAKTAESAITADNAKTATTATTAENAIEAQHAKTADSAKTAENSITADNARIATSALTAENAATALHAKTADNAAIADNAKSADNAKFADVARIADSLSGPITENALPASVAKLNTDQTFRANVMFSPGRGAPFAVGSADLVKSLNANLLEGITSSGFWKLDGNLGTTAGEHFLGTLDGAPLDFKVNKLRALRLLPGRLSPNITAGSEANAISAKVSGSTIGGGGMPQTAHLITSDFAVIGGGSANRVGGDFSTVAGGQSNEIQEAAVGSSVGGGEGNRIENAARHSGIHSGLSNFIREGAIEAVIAGGSKNIIDAAANNSTIGGGGANRILRGAHGATIPGGENNSVSANYGFAAGRGANARDPGAFVWSDSSEGEIASSEKNQFVARASGGFLLFSDPGARTGVVLKPGAGGWSNASDRNAKTNIQNVSGAEILERLASVPIQSWSYKAQDSSIRHIGPMAQDFAAAFTFGEDDRHISSVDADGVALAAIQELHRQLKAKDARLESQSKELQTLEAKNASLEHRLSEIELWMRTHSNPQQN